jgi:hypothetical protein
MELLLENAELLSLLALFVGLKSCFLKFMVRYGGFQPIADKLHTLFCIRYLQRRCNLAQLYQRSGPVQLSLFLVVAFPEDSCQRSGRQIPGLLAYRSPRGTSRGLREIFE